MADNPVESLSSLWNRELDELLTQSLLDVATQQIEPKVSGTPWFTEEIQEIKWFGFHLTQR